MRPLQFPKFSVNVRAASLYEEVKMRTLHTGPLSGRAKEAMEILLAFLLLASAFSSAVFAEALVRYVTPSGNGARNGIDWSNALGEAELHDALAAVDAGGNTAHEFRIAQGIYRPSPEMNRSRTFLLKKNVALYGGFAGNETDRDQRDWKRHVTILTGDLAGDDLCIEGGITVSADCIHGTNSNAVVTVVTGADATTILDGFVVTGGNASVSGGGCTSAQGSPVIRNCAFVGNAANNFGGGMYTDTGSPVIETCLFFGNRAGDYGGGFYTHSGKPVLSGCLFSDNAADKRGGGAYTSSGQPLLAYCTFSGNTTASSSGQGGAFFNESGSPLLKDCTLRNNLSARGGGAASSGGNFSVESSHFMANASPGSSSVGGAFFLAKGTLDAVNTTFTGNRASSAGGAVYEQNGTLRLRHCTLVENIAGNGGGLYIRERRNSGTPFSGVTTRGRSGMREPRPSWNTASSREIMEAQATVVPTPCWIRRTGTAAPPGHVRFSRKAPLWRGACPIPRRSCRSTNEAFHAPRQPRPTSEPTSPGTEKFSPSASPAREKWNAACRGIPSRNTAKRDLFFHRSRRKSRSASSPERTRAENP